jgi:hypothetical protein
MYHTGMSTVKAAACLMPSRRHDELHKNQQQTESPTQAHTHAHTHTHTRTHTHTHTPTPTHSHTHKHTLTHKQKKTHTMRHANTNLIHATIKHSKNAVSDIVPICQSSSWRVCNNSFWSFFFFVGGSTDPSGKERDIGGQRDDRSLDCTSPVVKNISHFCAENSAQNATKNTRSQSSQSICWKCASQGSYLTNYFETSQQLPQPGLGRAETLRTWRFNNMACIPPIQNSPHRKFIWVAQGGSVSLDW